MKYLPKNTLAYFKAAPQMHRMNIGHIPVSALAKSTEKYKTGCALAHPTKGAVEFYTVNHLVSVIQEKFTAHEPLPEWAVKVNEAYLQILAEQGNRMLHYIMAICTREMRHLYFTNVKPTVWAKIEKDNGPVMVDWLKKVKEGGEDKLLQRWFQTPPDVTAVQYMQALATAFHQPQGSAKPWPTIRRPSSTKA
jgi:hypothetical protein